MDNKTRLKLSLYINYFVFAILLNSVGIVILKSQQEYGVDEVAASTLELFKDLSIAFVSFFIASFLPRIGYKKSMLIGLGIVTIGCILMCRILDIVSRTITKIPCPGGYRTTVNDC